jgi:hypothetical protein
MCEKQMRRYQCGHTHFVAIMKCKVARERPKQRICTPQEAWAQDGINIQLNAVDANNQRFLPMALDVQDDNQPGRCPACLGQTPPSSRGSM